MVPSTWVGWVSVAAALIGCERHAPDERPAEATPSASSAAAVAPSAAAAPVETVGAHYRGCDKLETDMSHFKPWEDLSPFGALARPLAPPEDLPLVAHIHGHMGAILELDRAKMDVALAGVSFEPGSYDGHFANGEVFRTFIKDAQAKGKPQVKDELFAVTAWSNGYEGVRTLLNKQAIDAPVIVLLDALHGATDLPSRKIQLEPFVRWAERARKGEVFMFISHSGIPTYTYASTTQSADTLIEELGGTIPTFEAPALAGDKLHRAVHEGGLYVIGYEGADREAHCRQITLLPYALRLAQAWAKAKGDEK